MLAEQANSLHEGGVNTRQMSRIDETDVGVDLYHPEDSATPVELQPHLSINRGRSLGWI